MNKPLFATLLIIALVSKSIEADTCNDKSDNNSASSENCHKAKPENDKRCCYLEGLDKYGNIAKTCRNIEKDVSKKEEKLRQYVTDFYSAPENPYQFISLIDCEDSALRERNYYASDCMSEAKATDIDSCRSRKIEDANGMCCMLTGVVNEIAVKQCIEIKLNDRLDETKNYDKLLNGEYDTRLPKYSSVSEVTCGTPCELKVNPSGLSECQGLGVYGTNEEKCCYVQGTKLGENEEKKQCINIPLNDPINVAAKALTASEIAKRYASHKSLSFTDLSELSCPNTSGSFTKSECQKTKPTESNDCIAKQTSDNSKYKCAYLRGRHKGEDEEKRECVEVKIGDDTDDIDDDIKKGEYFPNYSGQYDKIEVLTTKADKDHEKKCKEVDGDDEDECGKYAGEDENSKCCYVKARDKDDETVKKCVSIPNGSGVSVVSTIISENNFRRIKKLKCKDEDAIYEQSKCEDKEPDEADDCEGRETADKSKEMCCYLSGSDSFGATKECVDIKIEDASKISDTQDKIKQGTYWPDFTEKYSEVHLDCNRDACGKIDPDDRSEECFTGDTGDENTECCYLRAKDEDDHTKEKCVSISKNNFNTTTDISRIISGTYFSGDTTKYSKIRELSCLGKEYYRESECENQKPDEASDCTGKTTEKNNEMCCYLKGKDSTGKVEECVDIKVSDVSNIDDVKQKIMQGTYWTDYTEPYTEVDIECRVQSSSGMYLKTSILLLLFALL